MRLFDKRDNVPNMNVINNCSSLEELQDYFDTNNLYNYNIQDFITADMIIVDNRTFINIDNSSTMIDSGNTHYHSCCGGQGDMYEEDEDDYIYEYEELNNNETVAIAEQTAQKTSSYGFGSFLWDITKGTAYIATLGTVWVAKELLWKPTHKVVSNNLDRLEDRLHQKSDDNILALDNPDIIDVEIFPKARQLA